MTKTEKAIQKLNQNNISLEPASITTAAMFYDVAGVLQANDDGLLFTGFSGELTFIPKKSFGYVDFEHKELFVSCANGTHYSFSRVEYPDAIMDYINHHVKQLQIGVTELFKIVNPPLGADTHTTTTDDTYHCPKCLKSFPWKNYSYIEVSKDDQEIKNRLIHEKEEFFEIPCPHCGNIIKASYPLQYVDTEKKLQVVLLPFTYIRNDEFERHLPEFHERPGYSSRLVDNFSYLLETITLFDLGLDDRFVQLFKLYCWLDFIKSDPKLENAVSIYQWYLGSQNGEINIMFVYSVNDEKDTKLWTVPESYFEELKERVGSNLSETKPFEKVGYGWAVKEYLIHSSDM